MTISFVYVRVLDGSHGLCFGLREQGCNDMHVKVCGFGLPGQVCDLGLPGQVCDLG